MKKEFVFDETAYAKFIMQNSKGDRMICNGDMLQEAMQEGYLMDDWLDSLGIDPHDIDY